MPTYNKIASTTLGSNTADVTLSSIDQTYTDLVIVVNCKIASSGGNLWARVNGDTGSNYMYNFMYNNGATTGPAQGNSTSNGLLLGAVASWDTNEAIFVMQINSYTSTAMYKTASTRGSNPSSSVDRGGSLWKSTAAINSLTFRNGDGTSFVTGSMFTIYGIKAA